MKIWWIFVVATFSAESLFAQLPQAKALFDEGRYDDAKAVLRPLTTDPEALHLLSRIAMAQADDEAAADYCKKAVELRPSSAEYHYCAGNALRSLVQHSSIFKQPTLSKEAREELNRAIELDPNHLPARFALLDYYLFAPSIAGGSEEKAFQQAAEIRKRDAEMGHRAYARIYTRQKKGDLARKEYTDGVRENPNSPRPHVALATYLVNDEKNYKAALDELEEAIRLDAGYMPAWFRLGQNTAISGANLPRGEEALKKYLACKPKENEPSLAAASYYLGMVFEKQGKKSAAREMYAAALKRMPGSKEVQDALKRMQ